MPNALTSPRSWCACRCRNDSSIFHSTLFFKFCNNLSNRRIFLTNCNINTINRFDTVFFCFFRMSIFLINNCIYGNSGFTSLSIPNY